MEQNETNAALNQTVSQLQGGVLRLGIGSAIPVIAGWERTLAATRLPALAPIAENLGVLRSRLASESFDPAEVGALLNELGNQVRAVTASPYGLPIAVPLAQLSLLLNAGGAALTGQSRD